MDTLVDALVLIAIFASCAHGSAFTFDLPDGESRCFYNSLKPSITSQIEFQVISGGNFDVDVTMRDPKNKVVKAFKREQYNYFDYEPKMNGDYQLCFSNEFSSFTHKVVYFSWETSEDHVDADEAETAAPLTKMDNSLLAIQENLRQAEKFQTRNRLQEEASRNFIEDLNDRVTWGSIAQACIIVVVAVGQVYLLRSLFKDPVHHKRSRMTPAATVHSVGF
ncbi:Transmembrane emp24 domain-containing protein 7 [Sparganum proliferum]